MVERKPVKVTQGRGDIIPKEQSSYTVLDILYFREQAFKWGEKKRNWNSQEHKWLKLQYKFQLRNLALSHKLEAYNKQSAAIVISCTKCDFQFHDAFLWTTSYNRWAVAFCWWPRLQFYHSSCLQQEIHSFVSSLSTSSSCSRELLTSQAHLYSLCGNSCGRANLQAHPVICCLEKGKTIALRCVWTILQTWGPATRHAQSTSNLTLHLILFSQRKLTKYSVSPSSACFL